MNTTATCASSSASSESRTKEHVARFGLGGDLGRFRAPAAGLAVPRGARVVLRTPRGVEIGQAVRGAARLHVPSVDLASGELLRLATPEDETVADRQAARARALLARGAALVAAMGLPVELLDAEVLLDGSGAVVHHVSWGDADLRELVRPLSRELELTITLTNVGRAVESGCGSCGEGGGCGDGGCGTGGCGSSCGTVSAEEVRAHFAELREGMERRMSLL